MQTVHAKDGTVPPPTMMQRVSAFMNRIPVVVVSALAVVIIVLGGMLVRSGPGWPPLLVWQSPPA